MMNMKATVRLFTVVLFSAAVLSGTSCSRGGKKDSYVMPPELDTLRREWIHYNQTGRYDSLIAVTRPYMARFVEEGDTMAAVYAGVTVAQAFLFIEDSDSVRRYLSLLDSLKAGSLENQLGAILYNIRGIYALKIELDYPKALKCFQSGYELAEQGTDTNHRIVLLTNMVNIFYIRGDRGGMDYARQAYALRDAPDVTDFYRCLAVLSMAQMEYLAGDGQQAASYVREADRLAAAGRFLSLTSLIALLQADLSYAAEDYDLADRHYSQALAYAAYAEPGIRTLICLNYGRCCEMRNEPEKAVSLYRQGLEISYRHRNVEYRRELLGRLTDLYSKMGDSVHFMDYYRKFKAHVDSVSSPQREQEFNELLLSYQKMEHEHELQSKELALLKANRKTVLAGAFSLVVLVLSVSFAWLLYRQRMMYRTLVSQHQQYLQRLERGVSPERKEPEDDSSEMPEGGSGSRELFLQVERLMRESRLYAQKDISLEKIAERLGTNRTYISRAINSYAGVSFPNYVNMFRIEEATRIISDPGNRIPLKQLADDLGFNSATVFSKAFQRETGCPPGRYRKEMTGRT